MEAEPRRWAATYTKHLKQKRKAYHDGALLLHPDSGRLVLLDDAGDTLESRFLRASEEVSAGAALSFHSYLVDVGEPEAYLAGSRSRSSSSAAASRNAHRGRARAGRPPSAAGRLNPSAPRAFVNPTNAREVEAAGSGGVDEGAPRFQEWTALYTAQLTQKAKKYHDGVVRLVKAGPYAKQIVLLDEDGQVLGSRHLKSGETIESGKKCTFPNYIIEICEAENEKEDIQRGTSTNSVWSEVGKSQSSNVGDPLKFHDIQDSISRCPTNFIRNEAGKSTFGKVDDSIRTASQILSIMKPPSQIKLPQDAPSGPERSLVSSNSRIPFDASHKNNLLVDDSNRTFDGRGYSGLPHCATQLRTSVKSCLSLDAIHTNNSVVDDSNRSFDGSGHSGMTHFATLLRTSVQSCLSLENPQRKISVMTHQCNESSVNSHPNQDVMSQDLAIVDILESEISGVKVVKADSGNHPMGSSNDTVPSDPGLQENKNETPDKLSTWSSIVGGKCDVPLSTSAYTLTRKDPKIQELIDDCPSFDLGF